MATPKLQRWMDLLAALLRHRYPLTFEEIKQQVPAYQKGQPESVRRTFERDKDELLEFGVPLEKVLEGGEVSGYQLRTRDFYLPYLSVVDDERRSEPRRVNRDGYRALESLEFTADQLAAVAIGGGRVLALGDAQLAGHARSALRKLAVDMPMDGVTPTSRSLPAPHDEKVLDLLSTALERRKRITFDYEAVATGSKSMRTVEPLGLFFLNRHWYLAARAPGETLVKNYRVSRISTVTVNGSKPGTADFARPEGFDLREHARQRSAWELGEGQYLDVVVEFAQATGVTESARRLGGEVAGSPHRRRYQVRRLDAFVRWLLPLAGQARPVEPPELVQAWLQAANATLALYREPA